MLRLLLVLIVLSIAPAWAQRVALSPPGTEVAIRVHGLGLLPLDGRFTRFHGWFDRDPATPGKCEVFLEAQPASLDMFPAAIGDEITGPDFLDAAAFPVLAYHGGCQVDGGGERLEGELTLHGQTHPFALALTHEDGLMVATGELLRAQWGMGARLWLGGETVRIRVTTPDPAIRKAAGR